MKLPRNLYSRLTLITCVTLITGYALVYAWTTLNPVDAGPGKPLTSTLMQAVMNNINELNTRTSNLSSNGENIGIGTSNPTSSVHINKAGDSWVIDVLNIGVTAATTASRPSTALNFFSPDIGTTGESYKVASIYSKFDVSDFAQTRLTFRGRINSAGSFGDIMTLRGGNVGIGTVSPSEKLDLWGGNIKMGLSYPTNVTIAINVASQSMSPVYQICPAGTSVIGGTCWTAASGNVACPAYYGVGGNANIQAWNCGNATANMLCSAICANMK